MKVTLVIILVGVTVNFKPLHKTITWLSSSSSIWSTLFTLVLVLMLSTIAWIQGVNNVYHEVWPSPSIEILATVFFVLLSFKKWQLQLVHFSTGNSWRDWTFFLQLTQVKHFRISMVSTWSQRTSASCNWHLRVSFTCWMACGCSWPSWCLEGSSLVSVVEDKYFWRLYCPPRMFCIS